MSKNLKRTKLIATLGPASSNRETMIELIKAGVDVFRINFSHADYDLVRKNVETIREINNLVNQVASYKSLLLEWSQKDKKQLEYQTFQEGEGKNITFRAIVVIEGQQVSSAMALSKKKAEEQAAEIAYHVLNDIKKN